jgi:NAD(P)-dependent dehydrogenase (short-subunit alcohol dehydrogenase family)
MTRRLDGLTAIVTGAGSGIGRAVALRFAAEGAAVLAVARSDSADATAQAARERGATAHAARCDVSVEADVLALYERFDAELGPDLNVLVNAAGIGSFTSTRDTDLRTWEEVFATNVRGVFLMCKHALARLRAPEASIVNVASVAGSIGVPDRAAYCASKGAVLAFTRALAVDHAREGIRVNALSPGTTDTPWIERVVADEGESRDDLAARQPIGRLGTAEEIAEAALYLASREAGFTTGTDLVVDGGATAR